MPEDAVFRSLGQALIARAGELRQALLWLDEHALHAADSAMRNAAGITELPAGHLFRAVDPADFRRGVVAVEDEAALAPVWKTLGVAVLSPAGKPMVDADVEPQAFTVFTQLFKDGEADDSWSRSSSALTLRMRAPTRRCSPPPC